MFGHVIHSLENPTPRRTSIVIWSVCFGYFVLSTLVGICGYLFFFQDVKDNILDNYENHTPFNTTCRFLLVIAITISAPYCAFMPRVSILALVQLRWPALVLKNRGPRRNRQILHICLTVALLGGNLLVAELVTDLGAVFVFVGALSAISISLVLPPLCYMMLEHTSRRMKIACISVLVLGIGGAIGAVATLIAGWV